MSKALKLSIVRYRWWYLASPTARFNRSSFKTFVYFLHNSFHEKAGRSLFCRVSPRRQSGYYRLIVKVGSRLEAEMKLRSEKQVALPKIEIDLSKI